MLRSIEGAALLSFVMRDSVRQPDNIRPPLHSDLIDPNSEPPPDSARFDRVPLGRTALWGLLAIAAAGVAFLSIRTDVGSQRIAALLSAPPAAMQIPATSTPAAPTTVSAPDDRRRETADDQIWRLIEEVRALGASQAAFSVRLEAIERSLDQTGSIPAAPPPPAAPTGSPPAASQTPANARHTSFPSFGLELGSGVSLESLRFLWFTVRAQHGAVVDGLAPFAAVDHRAPTSPVRRLVVGPMADRGSAMRACAVIGANGRPCRPAPFEGQPLE